MRPPIWIDGRVLPPTLVGKERDDGHFARPSYRRPDGDPARVPILFPLSARARLPDTTSPSKPAYLQGIREADAGTRTPDPFITSEVLYQLSYVGILALQRCYRQSWPDHVSQSVEHPWNRSPETTLHRRADVIGARPRSL